MKENFIQTYQIDDLSICDKLIDFHSSGKQYLGKTGNGQVDPEKKDSIDVDLAPTDPLALEYFSHLEKAAKQYIDAYPYCNFYYPWGVSETSHVQYYKPGGGYKQWHTERFSADAPFSQRHLVWMTYLNDITDAGGTEFAHQGVVIEPRKGLTVIWPADWTYTHRGVVSPTQEKYIITGWFSYFNN